jgi:glyoxylase-like metal-dependent hydrolase (beta-lactamase superfamily II)
MKVHHLNCGTMNMPTAPMVCHVLLVETDNGLVLVDSGFGSHDCLDSANRVGPTRHVVRPLFDHMETAAHQIERLGFRREDVRHIVITHAIRSPGIALVSVPGHTRGHTCVAVDAGHRWVLQAGDAFYHYGTLDGHSRVPRALTAMESLVAFDRKKVQDNHARLAELYQRQDPDLLIVCAHDPTLLEQARATA